jgi:ABC-2 type transport system ATP-binding protein
MAAIDVESLTITYGDVVAVDDVSFHAQAGQVTCVLGPNGAGKTSTIEALEGLRRPTRGRLSVVGLDPHADHRALGERIGVMLQDGGVHPAVRPLEALRHAAALYPRPLDPRGLLARLGITGLERRTYRQLSGGEQRRLALALALVGRPQVAFLDEPTAGVDVAGRQVIRQVIAELRGDGVTVLLATHDLDETERVADRVVIIDAGRLVATGTLDELVRGPGAGERVRFAAAPGIDTVALSEHLGGAAVRETAPGEYEVVTPPTPAAVAAVTGWLAEHDLPLADLRAGRQRLEDVFLRLTSSGGDTPGESDAGVRPSGGDMAVGQHASRTTAAGQPTGDQSTGDQPAEDQPAEDQPSGDDQPADDQPSGDDLRRPMGRAEQ